MSPSRRTAEPDQRFRITHNQAAQIELPAVRRWRVFLQEETLVIGDELDAAPLVDELYLRELAQLNLADVDALVDFSTTYGLLWHRLNLAEPFPYPLPLDRSLADFRHAYGTGNAFSLTLDELRVHARMLRALTLHWDRHAGAGEDGSADVAGAWIQEGFRPQRGRPTSMWAWGLFEMALNAGLTSFSPSIYVRADNQLEAPAGVTASLYAALCLQFRNHVVAQVGYRRCCNETCGQMFARQRGRSVSRQNRSDAIYCMEACARAQAQREYRRRKA